MPRALIFLPVRRSIGVVQAENQRSRGHKGGQEQAEQHPTGLETGPARAVQQAVKRTEPGIVYQSELDLHL